TDADAPGGPHGARRSRADPSPRGLCINLGQSTMATYAIGRDLLKFAGFRALAANGRGDYVAEESPPAELERRPAHLQSLTGSDRDRALQELQDAVFSLSPLPSLLVKGLVTSAGYRLVPRPFAEADCLDHISRMMVSGEYQVDRTSLFATEI